MKRDKTDRGRFVVQARHSVPGNNTLSLVASDFRVSGDLFSYSEYSEARRIRRGGDGQRRKATPTETCDISPNHWAPTTWSTCERPSHSTPSKKLFDEGEDEHFLLLSSPVIMPKFMNHLI